MCIGLDAHGGKSVYAHSVVCLVWLNDRCAVLKTLTKIEIGIEII